MEEQEQDSGRFYRIKRFVRYIGRLPDGTKLPGGPYTLTQGAVGVLAGFLLIQTNGIWTRGSFLLDFPIGGLLAWGLVFLTGRIKTGNQSPILLLGGLYTAYTSPAEGTVGDKPYRPPRPGSVEGTVLILDDSATESKQYEQHPDPVAIEPVPVVEVQEPAGRAVTALEKLVEASKK